MKMNCDWSKMKQISMLLKNYRDIHDLKIMMITRISRQHLSNRKLWTVISIFKIQIEQIQMKIDDVNDSILHAK